MWLYEPPGIRAPPAGWGASSPVSSATTDEKACSTREAADAEPDRRIVASLGAKVAYDSAKLDACSIHNAPGPAWLKSHGLPGPHNWCNWCSPASRVKCLISGAACACRRDADFCTKFVERAQPIIKLQVLGLLKIRRTISSHAACSKVPAFARMCCATLAQTAELSRELRKNEQSTNQRL